MAQGLETSISETVRLVIFSQSAVFSICVKWIIDGENSSRHQAIERLRIIKEKGRQSLSRLIKQNRPQTRGQLAALYNADPSTSVSEHTPQWTLLDMGLHSKLPTYVLLLTKCYSQLHLQWAHEHRKWIMNVEESCLVGGIMTSHSPRRWSCQGARSSKRIVALPILSQTPPSASTEEPQARDPSSSTKNHFLQVVKQQDPRPTPKIPPPYRKSSPKSTIRKSVKWSESSNNLLQYPNPTSPEDREHLNSSISFKLNSAFNFHALNSQ
ncbi:HTH_Tnp_Tc3_2 domain-containing protein [Trichonephila clavipes]|nr:HTH_Tnp_Tc3_2 domain-containing protein [Trichonephila clavipes]